MQKIIFKDTVRQTELILPVTPLYEMEDGVKVEIVNLCEVGDVALAGRPTSPALTLDVLFPAQAYPFCAVTPSPPETYVATFKRWAESGTVLRYVITGERYSLNKPVIIESIKHGERDGSGDIYATIHMRVKKPLAAVSVELSEDEDWETPGGGVREDEDTAQYIQSYTVVEGDILKSIARKFYGDAGLCYKLATYNNVANANIIWPGLELKIPPVEELTAVAADCGYTGPTGIPEKKEPFNWYQKGWKRGSAR